MKTQFVAKQSGLPILAILLLFAWSSSTNAARCSKTYRISSGVLKHFTNRRSGKPDVRIKKFTSRIPYYKGVELNPDYFGAIIRPRHRRPYTVSVSYEIPNTGQVDKSYFLAARVRGKRLILDEKPVRITGKGVVRMRLSDGDKPGTYKAYIRINKRLCRTLRFRVYKRR